MGISAVLIRMQYLCSSRAYDRRLIDGYLALQNWTVTVELLQS